MKRRTVSARFAIVFLLASVGAGCKGEVDSSEGAASASIVDAGDVRPATQAGTGAGGRAGAQAAQPAAGKSAGGSAGARASGGAGAAAGDSGAASADSGLADAGDAGSTPDASASDAGQAGQGEEVIVAVGYLGLRVASKDRGRTWPYQTSFPNPGGDLDNPLLLRAVAYGNGLFVAAGHRIFTSPNGIDWTERDNPQDQWLGGVQWGNNRFVAAGGYGDSWYSDDGITWHAGGKRGNNSHARAVAFGQGEFRASTDDGNWWRSTNGESWTMVSGGHTPRIAFCNDEFREREQCPPAHGHDVYIEGGEWNEEVIRWSDDGAEWHDVHVDYVGSLTGIAFGYD